MATLTINKLTHWYGTDSTTPLYSNVSLKFDQNKFYAIVGESGSGKTTLLSFLGGLDTPRKGDVRFSGKKITDIGLTKYRNKDVSIVFQAFNLIDYMTPLQNVMSALSITKSHNSGNREYVLDILGQVGISSELATKNVKLLSGGQQQRVAIARSISVDAPVILADEPTGNLDEHNTKEIVKIFSDLAHRVHKTVIVVTHDPVVSALTDQTFLLKNNTFTIRNKKIK